MKNFFSKMSKGKKAWLIFAAVIVVVILVLVVLGTRNNATAASTYQTVAVERGNLTATIGATGSVRSNQSAILTWQTTGTIDAINVQPGDKVQVEEVLATLSQTSLPQNVILARSDLVTAQRNLDNLRDSATQRAQAQLDLVTAQKNHDNTKATLDGLMAKNHGGTAPDIQNAQAQVIIAQQNLNAAQTYYDYTKYLGDEDPNKARAYSNLYNAQQSLNTAQDNLDYFLLVPSGRDVAEAQAKFDLAIAQLADAQRTWDRQKNGPDPSDIAAAQAKVDAVQATLNMAQISAPFAGTVTGVGGMAGDQVSPGTSAFRVDDLSRMQVDVQVSEVDINNVQVGQPVILTFDAISGKTYNGQIIEVAQAGDSVQGAVNFTVTVELTDSDTKVKSGMTAAVTITVKQLNDVLLVPNRAVRLVNNQRVVYILRNDQPVEVNVNLGDSSDTVSEVVSSNLKVGDLIILNPPSTLFNRSNGGGGGGMFGGGG